MSTAAWPVVLEVLVDRGPLSAEMAVEDLAYLADREAYLGEPMPSPHALARRWRRSRSFVRRMLADESQWKARIAKRTVEGQSRDSRATLADRTNADNEEQKDSRGTVEGQSRDSHPYIDTRAPAPHPQTTPLCSVLLSPERSFTYLDAVDGWRQYHGRAPLNAKQRLKYAESWLALCADFPDREHDEEVLKAAAWATDNPKRTPKNPLLFMRNWLRRARPKPKPKGTVRDVSAFESEPAPSREEYEEIRQQLGGSP